MIYEDSLKGLPKQSCVKLWPFGWAFLTKGQYLNNVDGEPLGDVLNQYVHSELSDFKQNTRSKPFKPSY